MKNNKVKDRQETFVALILTIKTVYMYLCIHVYCIPVLVFCVVFCIVNCTPANYLLPSFGGGKPNKKLFHKSHSLVVAICDATMQLLAAPPSPLTIFHFYTSIESVSCYNIG